MSKQLLRINPPHIRIELQHIRIELQHQGGSLMFSIHHLSKSYPPKNDVLHDINVTLNKGEFVAIVGASGSGKSTLLRCLSLQESWTSGHFTYQNKTYAKASYWNRIRLAKQFTLLDDKPYFNLSKSALKHVLKGSFYNKSIIHNLTGTASRNDHILGMDYLEHVGLLDKGHVKLGQLSGGEKQRVAIAKALIQGAQILFADEPVTGLDPQSVDMILNDMRMLAKESQISVVCVLNQLDLVTRYATRIIGLVDGSIQVDIPARNLTGQEKKLLFGS
jgi:phosphonate transport system ATP-binding protein